MTERGLAAACRACLRTCPRRLHRRRQGSLPPPIRLGQYLSSLRQALDLGRPKTVEARCQALLQDVGDLRRGMEPRHIDEVGASFVEMKRLWDVLGGEHDLRLRAVGADVP